MDSSPPESSSPQQSGRPRAHGCELTLLKGRHTWRFCCDHAEEPTLLSVIAELATGANAGLDQFDLAVLASQLQDHFAADHEAALFDGRAPSACPPTSTPDPPAGRTRSARSSDDATSQHAS